MKFSPSNDNTRPLMISVLLTVISIMCVYAASYLLQYKWLMQLLFICFATAAIQVLLKFVLTKYEYICENGSILIYKSVGSKKVLIANLELKYSESYFITYEELTKDKEKYNYSNELNYSRNLGASEIYCYITGITSKPSMIKFECSKEFADYVNNAIDESMKGTDENAEI